jgi:hypothetical protein
MTRDERGNEMNRRKEKSQSATNLEAFKSDLNGVQPGFGAFVENLQDEMTASGAPYRASADSEGHGLAKSWHDSDEV